MDVPLHQDGAAGGQADMGRADRRFAVPHADGWRRRDLTQLRLLQPRGPVVRGEPRRGAGLRSGDGSEIGTRGPRPATGARRGAGATAIGEEPGARAASACVPELSKAARGGHTGQRRRSSLSFLRLQTRPPCAPGGRARFRALETSVTSPRAPSSSWRPRFGYTPFPRTCASGPRPAVWGATIPRPGALHRVSPAAP